MRKYGEIGMRKKEEICLSLPHKALLRVVFQLETEVCTEGEPDRSFRPVRVNASHLTYVCALCILSSRLFAGLERWICERRSSS